MRSSATPPKTMAPRRPLPRGSASSHTFADLRYHNTFLVLAGLSALPVNSARSNHLALIGTFRKLAATLKSYCPSISRSADLTCALESRGYIKKRPANSTHVKQTALFCLKEHESCMIFIAMFVINYSTTDRTAPGSASHLEFYLLYS